MRTDPDPAEAAPPDYVERVNRALDHVVRNLERPLPLEEVARAACFSPFHFHRVFKALIGETLQQFVKRQRLERALYRMAHAPGSSLTEIALECGFSGSSDFSRSFKQRFGVPPSAFDLKTFRDERRGELERLVEEHEGGVRFERLPPGENPDGFEVRMVELPPRTVAYVRVLAPYREGAVLGACERLVAWAEARGRADGQWLGYMWEDPDLVPLDDCRYDAALVVDEVRPEGEVGRFEFPALRVAEVQVRGDIYLEQRALDWLYGTWLPRSGYVPDEQPTFEAWCGRPFAHGVGRFELDLHLPVVRAAGG